MAQQYDPLPEDTEFYDPARDTTENNGFEPVAQEARGTDTKRSYVVPNPKIFYGAPDLNMIAADLEFLKITGVPMDQIAAELVNYLKELETTNKEGFKYTPNSEPIYGSEARIAHGIRLIIKGCMAVRDPTWRNAVRKQARYYASAEELARDSEESPTEEDGDDAGGPPEGSEEA